MQIFSHPHVTVQRHKKERYNERVKSFLEECHDIEAHKQFRLLYLGEELKPGRALLLRSQFIVTIQGHTL